MSVYAHRCPTRIDLAGGTLDCWPLYLFVPSACTLNVPIDIYTQAVLKATEGPEIVLSQPPADTKISTDAEISWVDAAASKQYEFKFDNLHHFLQQQDSRFCLIQKIVQFFKPSEGFHLTTMSQSPVGAGLGASSSLCVALLQVFSQMCRYIIDDEKRLEMAHNLEAQALGCPTGTQDYISPLFTGFNLDANSLSLSPPGALDSSEALTKNPPSSTSLMHALHYDVTGLNVQDLDVTRAVFDFMLLVYTGQPHHSGLNNWQVLKLALDKGPDNPTLQSLQEIAKISSQMFKCFEASHPLESLVKTLPLLWQQEFEARCRLSPSFVSPRIEELKALVTPEGAEALKVCGAGGGGCCVLWAPPSQHKKLSTLCQKKGFQVLNFTPKG